MDKKKMSYSFSSVFILFLVLGSFQQVSARDIPVEGTWEEDGRRSLLKPLSVTIEDEQLCVLFRYPTPDVTVTIIKDGSVVEQITFTATALYTECFDLSEYGSGTYQISISDLRGNHVWADFLIE